MKELKPKSVGLQVLDDLNRGKSLHTEFEDILSRDDENRGGSTKRMAAKGRLNHAVELLSSDSASSDCPRPRAKNGPRSVGSQSDTKGRATTSRRRSRRKKTRSPSMSPESSHSMDYSYEDDTPSIGGTSQGGNTPFTKLKWPSDIGGSNEDGGPETKLDNIDEHCDIENQDMQEGKLDDLDVSLEEDDESNGEDTRRDPIPAESDGEELPVLPKVPVKRKVQHEPRACERRTQRGRPKNGSPHTKKQRTPQIDASVITQLQFGRRPENCVSLPSSNLLAPHFLSHYQFIT